MWWIFQSHLLRKSQERWKNCSCHLCSAALSSGWEDHHHALWQSLTKGSIEDVRNDQHFSELARCSMDTLQNHFISVFSKAEFPGLSKLTTQPIHMSPVYWVNFLGRDQSRFVEISSAQRGYPMVTHGPISSVSLAVWEESDNLQIPGSDITDISTSFTFWMPSG